jgi:hypothetical protein
MNDYICTKDYNKNYVMGMINCLENSISRAKYYKQSDDIRYLNESNEWITVASVYMREILNTYNKEKNND